ncbi:stress responsive a b barrel domain-containing protein [Endogone sp. FLAS-F59071]|nr:stress responsive a b barrel domain-containing protein [Endogone sp. FLAS-F59071]|eukprot:RUS13687.1 stress responsive a b barrel domain-containing protein [Endogone sp. FLAS-F59071]
MPVQHFVAFRFSPSVSPAQVDDACARFVALQQACLHPATGTPYILRIQHGCANSHEGADQGFTHGFLVTFADEADRDYYIGQPEYYDPQHDAFKKFVTPLLAGSFVFDFTVEKEAPRARTG